MHKLKCPQCALFNGKCHYGLDPKTCTVFTQRRCINCDFCVRRNFCMFWETKIYGALPCTHYKSLFIEHPELSLNPT